MYSTLTQQPPESGDRLLFREIFSEPRKVLPILKTDEPVCPEGKLSCGNGECIDKELFCNGKPDCKDESDENSCSELRTMGRLRVLNTKQIVKLSFRRQKWGKT